MPQTRQLPQSDWKAYFDDFTKRFFKDANPEVAIVEVVSPDLGSQVAADHVRAHGATYDPRSEALEIALDGVDHLVFHPSEVWVVEEENGFVSAMEVVREDGTREVVRFQSVGVIPTSGDVAGEPPA